MGGFEDSDISRAILDSYHAKFAGVLRSDVIIVGAGPSGLVAAWRLAQGSRRVVRTGEAPQPRRWHLGRQPGDE